MATITLHIFRISDRADSEITVLLLSREDAQKFVDNETLRYRVNTEDVETRESLFKMNINSPVYDDFLEMHNDKILYEVYPAEVFAKIEDDTTVEIKYDRD